MRLGGIGSAAGGTVKHRTGSILLFCTAFACCLSQALAQSAAPSDTRASQYPPWDPPPSPDQLAGQWTLGDDYDASVTAMDYVHDLCKVNLYGKRWVNGLRRASIQSKCGDAIFKADRWRVVDGNLQLTDKKGNTIAEFHLIAPGSLEGYRLQDHSSWFLVR
jgi:hypothetical protein